MAIRRLLGMTPAEEPQDELVPRPPAPATNSAATETVRRIIRELEQVEPERRKLLAGFAYVLSRAAHADLSFSDEETQLIEKIVADIGKLPESQAVLVVEIAKNQNDLYGGTEDYLVTREFAAKADPDQRRRTVEACSMIVASDEITAEEYAELTQIATKLAPHRPHQAPRTPRRQTRLPGRSLTEHGYVIEIRPRALRNWLLVRLRALVAGSPDTIRALVLPMDRLPSATHSAESWNAVGTVSGGGYGG